MTYWLFVLYAVIFGFFAQLTITIDRENERMFNELIKSDQGTMDLILEFVELNSALSSFELAIQHQHDLQLVEFTSPVQAKHLLSALIDAYRPVEQLIKHSVVIQRFRKSPKIRSSILKSMDEFEEIARSYFEHKADAKYEPQIRAMILQLKGDIAQHLDRERQFIEDRHSEIEASKQAMELRVRWSEVVALLSLAGIGLFIFVRINRQEKKLIQSVDESKFYREIVMQAKEVVIMVHDFLDQGRVLFTNKMAEVHLGLPSEKIRGMHVNEFDIDINEERHLIIHENLMKGDSFRFESRHRNAKGDIIPVEVVVYLAELSDKLVSVSYIFDLSERKAREQERIAYERDQIRAMAAAQLLDFSKSAPGVMFVLEGSVDDALVLTFVSENAFAMLGVGADILKQQFGSFRSILDEADFNRLTREIKTALQTQQSIETNLCVAHPQLGKRHIKLFAKFQTGGSVKCLSGFMIDETDHRQLLRQQKEEHLLNQSILQHIPYQVIRYDKALRRVYVNRFVEDFYQGYLEIGKTPFEDSSHFFSESSAIEYLRQLSFVLEEEQLAVWELTMRSQSGDRIHLMAKGVPEYDPDGQIIGVLVFLSNITEQKMLQREIELAHRYLNQVLDNLPDPVYVRNERGELITLNNAAKTLIARVGLSERDFLMRSSDKLLPWEPVANREASFSAIPDISEESIKLTGDELLVIASRQTKFLDEENQGFVVGVGRDISEYVKLQAVLHRKEQDFRTLSENAPVMIVRFNLQFKSMYVNPYFEEFTGLTEADVLERPLSERWGFNLPYREFEAMIRDVVSHKQTSRLILDKTLDDGYIKILDVQIVPEYDAANKVSGCLMIGHDITELKHTEIELLHSKQQLQKLYANREMAREQERKRIAREIHDELGQLLSLSRLNFSEIDYLYSSTIPELKPKIHRAVQHIDTAIATVRKLSKSLLPNGIDHGIGLAISSMVKSFSETTGINASVELPEMNIMLSEEDSVMVYRIVQESLTNVLRHANATQVNITLAISNSDLIAKVTDNGKGFNRNAHEFKTNLGIAGMSERASILGGHLEIQSYINEGTSVTLTMPYEKLQGEG